MVLPMAMDTAMDMAMGFMVLTVIKLDIIAMIRLQNPLRKNHLFPAFLKH